MTLEQFTKALNDKFGAQGYFFSVDAGLKYNRVVVTNMSNRSCYCFVDNKGNVYKAASWKAPAKGVRATLVTLDMNKVDVYTTWLYLR